MSPRCFPIAIVGLLMSLLGQVAGAQLLAIDNASFENATGYRAETAAPSSWLYGLTNLTDSSGSTAGDSYVEQVKNDAVTNKVGNNYLYLSLEVGPTPISGKTVTAWVSTGSLGTYQADKLYTLTVAQTAAANVTNRKGIIALAADGVIVASTATAFNQLNPTGTFDGENFQDKLVTLNTARHPEVVGKAITVQLLQQAADGAQYGKGALFDNVRLDMADAPPELILNWSFENATGYRAETTAPSSWLYSLTNLTDSSGSTAGDGYVEQVKNDAVPNKHGNNYLYLSLEVGPTPISGKTVTAWVSTDSLGIYAPNTLYTLTVAQTASTNVTNRKGIIALASDGIIAASTATPFNELNSTGLPAGQIFQDKQVVLDTTVETALVGQSISVQLLQTATDGAQYGKGAIFDSVRLDVVDLGPYGGGTPPPPPPPGGNYPPPPTPQPAMGINLTGPSDWNSELPFVDVFRLSRTWVSQQQGAPWGTGPALELDANGWVKHLDTDCWAETLMFTDIAGHYPAGQYTVLYEGEGQLTFSNNVQVIDASQPGRMVIDVNPSGGTMFMQLRQTNPANYIRNIHIIMPGFEGTWQSDPFTPAFVHRWQGVACFRFMDWMSTNNSPIAHWTDRPMVDNATFTTAKGIPLEVMIDLCNRQQVNPWFCMPHQADDDYVRQFATLVQQQLDPTLKVYIEYSNEVWNSMFQQNAYARQQALALGLGDPSRPWEGACLFYAQRSIQIFKIWEEVFGGKDRLVRVLAWQAAADPNYWLDGMLLAGTLPGEVDALAVAPYMAFNIPATSSDPNALTADVVAQWSVDQVLDYVQQTSLPQSIQWMTQCKGVANKYGLRLMAYEAGQHLVGIYGGQDNTALTALLGQANAHARMGQIYTSYFQAWQANGGDLMDAFASVSKWGKSGSWGLLQYADEDASVLTATPKFMATMQWAQSLGQPVNVPQ
ncbi:MAG: hypothetical protein ACYC26_08685 [Phycisphaerales bacterium]